MYRAVASLCLLLLLAPSWAAAKCESREGKKLWLEGAKSYNLGNYEDAAKQWEAAYLTCEDPEILFNLAQAHRKLGNLERSRDLFKSWLRENPAADSAEREEVKEWVAGLEARIEEERRVAESPPVDPEQPTPSGGAPAPLPPAVQVSDARDEKESVQASPIAPADSSPRELRRSWYADSRGWMLAGSGVAGLLAAWAITSWARGIEEEARSIPYEDEAARRFDYADTTRTIGAVVMVAGGALIAGGIAHFVYYRRSRLAPSPSVTVGAGWIGFTWSY